MFKHLLIKINKNKSYRILGVLWKQENDPQRLSRWQTCIPTGFDLIPTGWLPGKSATGRIKRKHILIKILKKEHMELLQQAEEFEKRKWSRISTSERVQASRDLKKLILEINEVYKRTRDQHLMEVMKRLTSIKKKVEKRLKMRVEV